MSRFIAGCPSTSPETLNLLSRDDDVSVRCQVARNPSTPPEALAFLSQDEDTVIRRCVARNPRTPPNILTMMGHREDRDIHVYWNAAKNPSTPYGVWLRRYGRMLP